MNPLGAERLARLIRRARAGDARAFHALVEETHRTVYRVAHRMLGSSSDAEDVTQETYVRVWQGLDGLRDERAALGWICRIARNVATDTLRSRGRRPARSLDATGDGDLGSLIDYLVSDQRSPEQAASDRELVAALAAVVDQLKPAHRTVLLLRDADGMSYEEIAAAIDRPIGTVESRLHRARRELATRLERHLRAQKERAA